MIDIENKTDTQINTELLTKIADAITKRDVELILTDNTTIQNYNREYRHLDKPT
ncbi:MAG: rRNA maturation RNAse YbeY, partial [Epsilonproteobacteria bacterium]|nr:rRNA maturation RNAse YbeY [Campylobacterota bacterium]